MKIEISSIIYKLQDFKFHTVIQMYGIEIVNGETTLANNHTCNIVYQYKSGNNIPRPKTNINWKIDSNYLINMSKERYDENVFNNEEKKESGFTKRIFVDQHPQFKISRLTPLSPAPVHLPAPSSSFLLPFLPNTNQQSEQPPDNSDESSSDDSDISESKQNTIQEVLSSLQIGIESGNDQRFWNMITSIRCYDKDEGIMRETNIKFPKYKCKEILQNINRVYMPVLKNKLEPYLNNIELEEDKKNFMTHIICKGKQFYDVVLNDPTVCLYLCDKYYPLHTWLSNKLA